MANPSPPERGSSSEPADPTVKMSFFDHLVELRKRLIYSLIAVGLGLVVGLIYADKAYEFLVRPLHKALVESKMPDHLVYLSPITPIQLYIEVGLYLGIVIASPFVFYQLWLFVAPGLYRHERSAVAVFLTSSVLLFLAGMAFAYFVMLPMSLSFLLSITPPTKYAPMLTMDGSLDMILVILLGLGIVFQLPILIFFLSLFGIVTPRFLWNNFRYAILIIAIIAAVVTPTTDALTMTIFMAPMIVLYLLGIGVSALVVRKKQRAEAAASAGAP
jgi:sec-independent protein translocase protein TatC